MPNEDRIAGALRAMQAHTRGKHIGDEDDLTDILTDLRHFADRAGLNFDRCDDLSAEHFKVERWEHI